MQHPYRRVKLGCYLVNVTMAAVCTLSPLLFITFHNLYGISFSLLGLLVLINFCTQLSIDLIFSFFSHRFHIPRTVKLTPILAILGFAVYALAPTIFPDHVYLGLALGTVIFSAASGLSEVLISPTIAAIPSDQPDREMSLLHSIYAWGVVGVVIFSSLFLLLLGEENWQFLPLFLTAIPLLASLLFLGQEIPQIKGNDQTQRQSSLFRSGRLPLCVLAIFLGGAAECTMSQWASGYLEQALGLPKLWGDILGVAMFALFLGLGRTLFAKRGKRIERVLFLGAIGATLCYLVAALSPIPVLGLAACALTGFCTSMLWPGSLIVGEHRFPQGGVILFAIMAAGGDLGASIGPQLIGILTDTVAASPRAAELAATLQITAEQLGMKVGMLVGAIFPLLACLVFGILIKSKNKEDIFQK